MVRGVEFLKRIVALALTVDHGEGFAELDSRESWWRWRKDQTLNFRVCSSCGVCGVVVKRNQASIGAHAEKEVIPEVSDELSLNGRL